MKVNFLRQLNGIRVTSQKVRAPWATTRKIAHLLLNFQIFSSFGHGLLLNTKL